MTTRRLTLVLALAVLGLAGGWLHRCRLSGGAPDPATAGAEAQVSLFWGGGAPRAWAGTVRVTPADPRRTRVEWSWLTDFEEGDRCRPGEGFPADIQGAPARWRPASEEDWPDADPPAAGAALATRTDGDADGVCFGVVGERDARVVLDLGEAAVLDAALDELLSGPVTVPVGDGNVLLAQAVDLRGEAPLAVEHAGGRAHRASLHTHSCFSTNEMALGPVARSLRPFARTVWWTDHNIGNERRVLGGDFEDPRVVRRFWRRRAEGAELVFADLDGPARTGQRAFRLAARGGDGGGRAWIDVGKGAGQLGTGLCVGPAVRWAWQPLPTSDGAASVAFAQAELSSGRVVRYLSGPAPGGGDPATDVVVAGEPDARGWIAVERDVAADARALHGEVDDDALRFVSFGVLCPEGVATSARFDDVELVVPDPPEVIRRHAEHVAGYRFLRSYTGLEDSAWLSADGFGVMYPHLTALVADGADELFRGHDRAPSADERRAFVASVQAAGGCVATHHMQVDEHYEALLDAGAFGIDLFEIGGGWWHLPAYSTAAERRDRDAHGYPSLTEDEVHPVLVRWDRLTARGLLLAGYGAPDLHFRFERPSYGWMNRWLTWIQADDDDPQALLDALRSGRASAGEWRSAAVLSLTVDGRPWMGRLVATDRPEHRVEARVTGALPGSRLRWIRGPLVRARAGSPVGEPEPAAAVRTEPVPAAEHRSVLDVATRAGVFVRAELLNPAGHLVALSNPVAFVPYWPERWPAGRVAFDWRGVHPTGERGLLLEDARVGADGTLVLRGTARAGDNGLAVAGPGLEPAGGSGGWTAVAGAGAGRVEVADVPPGAFELRVAPAEPWTAPPTADVRALPMRKELLLTVDVGVPAAEEPYAFEGFGRNYRGPLLLAGIEDSYRVVGPGPASFRLPLPPGERVWLRLATFGFSRATGRLRVDGRVVGELERMSSRTFAVEPAPGGDGTRAFTIELDPPADGGEPDTLMLTRIEVWRGDGIVDW